MYNYESYLTTQPKLDQHTLNHGMAYLAKLPLIKNAAGLVSPKLTIADWIGRPDKRFISGIINAFRQNSRMQLFTGKQTADPFKRFNKGVPLVLSAFKEYNGIGYASWDWREPQMSHLLDEDFQRLVPYITAEVATPNLSLEEKLRLVSKLDIDKYTITKSECPELYGHPILLKHILLQTWVCQPAFRHPLMILDLKSLDNVPESIYGDLAIFKQVEASPDDDPFRLEKVNPATTSKKKPPTLETAPDLPWGDV